MSGESLGLNTYIGSGEKEKEDMDRKEKGENERKVMGKRREEEWGWGERKKKGDTASARDLAARRVIDQCEEGPLGRLAGSPAMEVKRWETT